MLAKTQCARCEREVLLASSVSPGNQPGLFELADYPIEEVAPEARYAYNRRLGKMADLNSVPDHLLPKVCTVAHMCAVNLDELAEIEMDRKRLNHQKLYRAATSAPDKDV